MVAKHAYVQTIKTYGGILKRRWLPASAILLAVWGLGAFAVFRWQKPVYVAEGQLRFSKVNPISKLTNLGTEISTLDALDVKGKPLNTEAAVIRSIPILQQTLNTLGWSPTLSPKYFQDNLSISEIQGSTILRLTYRARESNQAAAAVNTLMQVYLEKHLQDNRQAVETASALIAERLPTSERAVKQAEAALRRFKQKNKIVDLKNREVDAETKMTTLQSQISDANASLAKVTAESELLRSKLGMTSEQAVAAVSLSQSGEVQTLLTQLRQTEAQLALQQNQLTRTHPTVVALERDVSQLKTLLQQRAKQKLGSQPADLDRLVGGLQQDLTAELVRQEVTRQGLARQVQTLQQTLDTYQQQLQVLPALAEQQRELERKLEAAQSTYALLLRKQQEVQADANQNAGNARILAHALPPTAPVSRGESAYMAVALLGVLAFLITAYVLEALDQSLRTVQEILEHFGYPLLGVIPIVNNVRTLLFYDGDLEQVVPQIFLRDYPNSPVSESYRMLQVSFKAIQQSYRTVVVTSSLPQEGKSTVVANLAMALGQAGNQVLIIDANLRYPFQDLIWELTNEVGLSNLLFGQAPLTAAIQSVSTNVDVLPAGNLLTHAVSALESQQMALMLKSIQLSYDLVLIDAPSLHTSADVAILSAIADGVMVVVKPGVATAPSVAKAKEQLLGTGQPVMGLLINGALSEDQLSARYLFEPQPSEEDDEFFQEPPVQAGLLDSPQPPVTLLASELPEIQLLADHNAQDIDKIPLKTLQNHVAHLQKTWMRSAHFVHEQEEELLLISQSVAQLKYESQMAQDFGSNATSSNPIMLELQLADQLEQQKLLEETLVGQRQRLRRQKMIFQQYAEILKQRTRLQIPEADHPQETMGSGLQLEDFELY